MQWPNNTSFLFGPRGTGKTTWIRQNAADHHLVDLLDTSLSLELEKRPASFRERIVGNCRPEQWIIIDEVQKNPSLLDEVHFLRHIPCTEAYPWRCSSLQTRCCSVERQINEI